MKIIAIVFLTFVTSSSFAVECTFSVKLAKFPAIVSTVFHDEQPSTEVILSGFKASYSVDIENQLETISVTTPDGGSVSPQYPLGMVPRMSIHTHNETSGDESTLICVRE